MKEERMAILRMLKNGIITVEQAKELLIAMKKESSGKDLLNKAGDMMKSLVIKAEKWQPKVKETAEKATQKATVVIEDTKNYIERLRQKRQGNEYSWEEDEFEEDDFEDIPVAKTEQSQKTKENEEEIGFVAEEDVCMKNFESYINAVENQMKQLDDAEAFLRSSFGNPDDAEWMEEEIEEKPEVKPEVKPEEKTEVKPEVKTEVKPEVKHKSKTKAKGKVEDKTENKEEV